MRLKERQEKIKKRMAELGIKRLEDLAEKAGIPLATLHKIYYGYRHGSPETLDAIAKALGFSSWAEFELWDPEGPKTANERVVRIPFYNGEVPAGFPNNLGELEVEWLEFPESWARMLGIPTDGSAFAVRIHGNSMYPRLEDGQVAIFQRNPPLILGRIYLVRTPNGEITVKRVLALEGGDIILKPENPQYPTIRVPAQDTMLLGLLVASAKREDF